MLKLKTFLFVMICFVLSGCMVSETQTNYFGFKPTDFTIVEEKDTHGGFFGEGYYYLTLDCSQKPTQAHDIIQHWNELPLSDNVEIVMYGGEKNGINYGHNFAEYAHWPRISNGVYWFVDRSSDAVDKLDDTDLLSRYSFNFSVAVYDLDTDTLYYFEMDT